MSYTDITTSIDKIEDALNHLSQNPKGSWTGILKKKRVPYYANITSFLSKRGVAVKDGNGLKWVGDKPTRTLAALIYEEAKAQQSKPRPEKITEETLRKALAVMETAIRHEVKDPIKFTLDLLQDSRI